eukprot:gene3841-3711_t
MLALSLCGKAAGLKGKMQLMALLHHIFITPVHSRTFKFQTVDEVCNTATPDDVEPLPTEWK